MPPLIVAYSGTTVAAHVLPANETYLVNPAHLDTSKRVAGVLAAVRLVV